MCLHSTPHPQTSLHFSQVVVSSGGMYLAKLDPDDLNLERMRNFDGSLSYAQNKVNSRTNIVCTNAVHTHKAYTVTDLK